MAKTKETWATTLDNPFNPFKDMENWKRYDEDHGYHTTSLLCRYMANSEDLGDEEYNKLLEEAVDTVVRFNLTGNYRKVVNEG